MPSLTNTVVKLAFFKVLKMKKQGILCVATALFIALYAVVGCSNKEKQLAELDLMDSQREVYGYWCRYDRLPTEAEYTSLAGRDPLLTVPVKDDWRFTCKFWDKDRPKSVEIYLKTSSLGDLSYNIELWGCKGNLVDS